MSATGSNALPAVADLDTLWPVLKENLDLCMAGRQAEVPYAKYMYAYTLVYNYCTTLRVTYNLDDSAGSDRTPASLLGRDLYDKLKDYFGTCSNEIRIRSESVSDQDLISFYATEWNQYRAGAEWANRCFGYLNRLWVRAERDRGKTDVYQVYVLAFTQWRDKLFCPVQRQDKRLVSALLRTIESARNGENIDTELVKGVIESLVTMDVNDTDPTATRLEIYEQEFEGPLLEATRRYYDRENVTLLDGINVQEREEKRLPKTESQLECCLHSSTIKKLLNLWEDVVSRHQAAV